MLLVEALRARLRAARRRPARDALETRAVAHHRELAAVAAGIALVALQARHLGRGERLARRRGTAAAAQRRDRTARRLRRDPAGRGHRVLGEGDRALAGFRADRIAAEILVG